MSVVGGSKSEHGGETAPCKSWHSTMFSKIFNSAKAIIRKTRTEQELYNHTQPARQLQSELSNAVGEGMVTTRRQSHGLPNEELRDGSEIDTPRNISRKRKNKESAASTPLALPVKRRKTSLEHLDNDGQMPSGPSVPTPTPSGKEESTVQEDKAGNDAIESHKREKDSLELGARQFTSKSEAGNEDCDKTPGVKHKEQGASSQGNKATANRALQIQGDHLRVEAPDLTVTPDSETTRNAGISTAPKAIHFRFGSEEPSANATNMNNGQVLTDALSVSVVEGSEESDAEDEAPEIVSASVGAKRAKARNQEADKAAERYCTLCMSFASFITDATSTGNGQQLKRNAESGMQYLASRPDHQRRSRKEQQSKPSTMNPNSTTLSTLRFHTWNHRLIIQKPLQDAHFQHCYQTTFSPQSRLLDRPLHL